MKATLKVTEGLIPGSTRHSAPKPKAEPVSLKLKIGRNEPCYCGSGKKYKRCCLRTGPIEPSPEYTGSPDIVKSDLIAVEGLKSED